MGWLSGRGTSKLMEYVSIDFVKVTILGHEVALKDVVELGHFWGKVEEAMYYSRSPVDEIRNKATKDLEYANRGYCGCLKTLSDIYPDEVVKTIDEAVKQAFKAPIMLVKKEEA